VSTPIERKMFLLEADGERFWYAAPTAQLCRIHHMRTYSEEPVEDGDFVEQPLDLLLTVTDVDDGHKITMTCAEWIRHEERSEGGLVREIANTVCC